MKISIIVPVYNVEPYIRECFDSIAAQTYQGEMECIFVDDCGRDRSVEMVEGMMAAYHGPIQFSLVHHEHNRGLSAARNTGICHSTGDYLYFIDSDDTITPDCIRKLAALAEKYPGVDLVQGSAKSKLDFLQLADKNLPEYSDDFKWIRTTLLQRFATPMTAWNKLARRDFIIHNNLYFEEGLIHEDELWKFMLAKYVRSIAFCTDETYYYRENPNGIMGQGKGNRCGPVVRLMVDRASGGPYLLLEVNLMLSFGMEEFRDILAGMNRFHGVRAYIWLYGCLCKYSKYTLRGFVSRVLIRMVRIYVGMMN